MSDRLARFLQFVLPRRTWYRKFYLNTEHWKRTATEARIRAGHRCDRCGVRGGVKVLDVHHLTYKHLWREYPVDLQVLCRDCHKRLHKRRGR